MLLFGVTGGIGSGKSVVCNFLKEKDVPIIEADPLAKELTNRLPDIRQALMGEFGEDVYTPEKDLNKDKLSHLVFTNPEARERINQIIHPHVFKAIEKRVNQLQEQNQKFVGVEAALIYESEMEQMLDAVVVISAPLNKRVDWIKERDGFSKEEIHKRIDSQMPLEEKVKRADYVIANDAGLIELKQEVDDLYKWLCSRRKL